MTWDDATIADGERIRQRGQSALDRRYVSVSKSADPLARTARAAGGEGMIEYCIIVHCDGHCASEDGRLFCLNSITMPDNAAVAAELERSKWKAIGDKHLCNVCAKLNESRKSG